MSRSNDSESTYEFYMKSKLRLAMAGFRLRKFPTNLDDLICKIQGNESSPLNAGADNASHQEEDQSFAKSSLGVKAEDKPGINKVLGVQWNVDRDEFQFDFQDVISAMEDLEPTKSDVTSATAWLFDPQGVVSPVTILFKMFCQQLCEARIGWDEILTGSLLEKWECLLVMMKETRVITVLHCLHWHDPLPCNSMTLIGFCDASTEAYAAIVCVKFETEGNVDVKFVAAKTRVAPIGGVTIPRLELLSAMLLSKLITGISSTLKSELQLDKAACFIDPKVSLFWIQGVTHKWKQFVKNRVNTITSLLHPQHWRLCPGEDNPTDIPSRGTSTTTFIESSHWLRGPDWLHFKECLPG